jgi:dTDP-4-dehydrorhamnose reductase
VRVLVTGAGGQLGRELVDAFDAHDVTSADRQQLDVSVRDDVESLVSSVKPDVVLHAAAYTDVDGCEAREDYAFAVNEGGTLNLTQAAEAVGAYVVTFSTDYVFDGTKSEPYVEDDETNPLSAYGRSKLAAEHAALTTADSLVVRLSWVCGRHGQNMVKTILRLAGQHDRLTFVDDQRGHPTFAADAAAMVRDLVDARWTGIVHVTNQGAVSWFEFARAVLEAAGDDPERVAPIKTQDLKPARPAPRPANSVLANQRLQTAGVELLPDFREPLDRLVRELTAG